MSEHYTRTHRQIETSCMLSNIDACWSTPYPRQYCLQWIRKAPIIVRKNYSVVNRISTTFDHLINLCEDSVAQIHAMIISCEEKALGPLTKDHTRNNQLS